MADPAPVGALVPISVPSVETTVGVKHPYELLAGVVAGYSHWQYDSDHSVFDHTGRFVCSSLNQAGQTMATLGWFEESTASRHIAWQKIPPDVDRADAVRAL